MYRRDGGHGTHCPSHHHGSCDPRAALSHEVYSLPSSCGGWSATLHVHLPLSRRHACNPVEIGVYVGIYMLIHLPYYSNTYKIIGECSRCGAPDGAIHQLVLRTAHLQAGTYVRHRNGGLLLFATLSPRSRATALGILLQTLDRTRVRAPALDGHHRE